jgi:PAB1-binding protein PBP1
VLRDPEQKNPGTLEKAQTCRDQASGGPRGAWLSVAAINGGTQSLAGINAAIGDCAATLTTMPVGSGPAMPCPMAAHIAAQGGSCWAG